MSTRKERSVRNRTTHAVERATVIGKKAPVDPLDEKPMPPRPALVPIPWNKVALTEEGREAIGRALLQGHPRNEIARALGTTVATLRRIIRDEPTLVDAVDVRKDVEEAELRDILMGMARRGDTVAAIFLVKAQFGWRDRDDAKVRLESARSGVLVMPAAPASIEDFEAAAYRQQAPHRQRAHV